MFKEYAALVESRSRSPAKKRQLADQIAKALTVHATIEEEIFCSCRAPSPQGRCADERGHR